MLIVTDAWGFNELRELVCTSYDFEIGDDENSFEITIQRGEWEPVENSAFIYIPGTEFGGLVDYMETDTGNGTVKIGGYTWRGILQKAFIIPPKGQDYYTASGDVNDIIAQVIGEKWTEVFVGADAAGVTVSNYQFERYCSIYDGLKKMLASVDMKLVFNQVYQDNAFKLEAKAAPIVDLSERIDISSDMRINYKIAEDNTGAAVLICLGSGELKNRTVKYIYYQGAYGGYQGEWYISDTWLDIANIYAEVYDNPGAEVDDLIDGGKQRMLEIVSNKTLEVDFDADIDVPIGDIVGGTDYLSGMTIKAPIIGKILRMQNGIESTEYKLGTAMEG